MSQTLFLKALKSSIDESQMILTAVVGSTGIVDRQGESVNPEGWQLDNFMKNPVILYAHDYSSLPIGKALKAWYEDGQLLFTIQFANTAMAKEVFALYQEGFLSAFSVGFIPIKRDDSGAFTYAEAELLELSAVPVPANPEALALSAEGAVKLKSLEAKFAQLIQDAKPTEKITMVPVQKIGRTLSAKHEALLKSAAEALTAVLASLSGESDDKTVTQLDQANVSLGAEETQLAVLKVLRASLSLRSADQNFGEGLRLLNELLKPEKSN